jgi:hypothetical protein
MLSLATVEPSGGPDNPDLHRDIPPVVPMEMIAARVVSTELLRSSSFGTFDTPRTHR